MKLIQIKGKKILAAIGVLLMIGVSAGCSSSEGISWQRLKETHYRMITGERPNSTSEKQSVGNESVGKEGQDSEKQAKKVNVVLYFADQNGDYLVAEKREIDLVPGLARATVEELIKGPSTKGLSKTIPDGTELVDINIKDGLCTVDLSKEFRDNHWGGSSGEILTVYSLVNTLTQFPSVDKVAIYIEGKKIDTLAGHMDLTVPVYRNSQIINNLE